MKLINSKCKNSVDIDHQMGNEGKLTSVEKEFLFHGDFKNFKTEKIALVTIKTTCI